MIIQQLCPICGGRGKVSAGFYEWPYGGATTATVTDLCRNCKGSGIVHVQQESEHHSVYGVVTEGKRSKGGKIQSHNCAHRPPAPKGSNP